MTNSGSGNFLSRLLGSSPSRIHGRSYSMGGGEEQDLQGKDLGVPFQASRSAPSRLAHESDLQGVITPPAPAGSRVSSESAEFHDYPRVISDIEAFTRMIVRQELHQGLGAELTKYVRQELINHQSEADALLTTKVKQILNQILSDGCMVKLIQQPAASEKQLASINDESKTLAQLKAQLEERSEMVQKLREEVESLRPKQFAHMSGAFETGGPSPPLLQEMLGIVQTTLNTCGAVLRDKMKPAFGKSINHATFLPLLCDSLFLGFESANSFFRGTAQVADPHFQRPNRDLKSRLFKEFVDLRAESESSLLAHVPLFRSFYESRLDAFVSKLRASPMFADQPKHLDGLRKLLELKSMTPSLPHFARVAKGVWLLHKLAFSFQPSAEIFRVDEGSLYDAEYMAPLEGDGTSVKLENVRVAFMVVPGFTVRNFVLKATVKLIKVK